MEEIKLSKLFQPQKLSIQDTNGKLHSNSESDKDPKFGKTSSAIQVSNTFKVVINLVKLFFQFKKC